MPEIRWTQTTRHASTMPEDRIRAIADGSAPATLKGYSPEMVDACKAWVAEHPPPLDLDALPAGTVIERYPRGDAGVYSEGGSGGVVVLVKLGEGDARWRRVDGRNDHRDVLVENGRTDRRLVYQPPELTERDHLHALGLTDEDIAAIVAPDTSWRGLRAMSKVHDACKRAEGLG